MERVQCEICKKFISKKNISRHKLVHGLSPCLRCSRRGISASNENGIVRNLGIHYWFQSYQYRLAASLIYDVMKKLFTDMTENLPPEIIEGYFEAALYHLEYSWLWCEPLKSTIFFIIKQQVYENINII